MIAEGLLWFDDDPRRPLREKIAAAIARYSERTGWQPTVCETHPAQAESFNAELARTAAKATNAATTRRRAPQTQAMAATTSRAAKANAAPAVTLPPKLRVMPNAALRPGYFLVGMEPGERPHKAVSQQTGAARRKSPSEHVATPEPPAPPTRAHATKSPRVKAS